MTIDHIENTLYNILLYNVSYCLLLYYYYKAPVIIINEWKICNLLDYMDYVTNSCILIYTQELKEYENIGLKIQYFKAKAILFIYLSFMCHVIAWWIWTRICFKKQSFLYKESSRPNVLSSVYPWRRALIDNY